VCLQRGEWHTYPHGEWVPEFAKEQLVEWYAAAFSKTHLSARYPFDPAYNNGYGYNDGSFAYHTLDNDVNGGVDNKSHYFWPIIQAAGHQDFWRWAPMGGEVRPEIQPIIFEPDYPAGTFERQDFILCVETTHASYIHFVSILDPVACFCCLLPILTRILYAALTARCIRQGRLQ